MSCREIAKVGQLVLNKGKWLDADNKPYQMSDAAYLEQTKEPAFPGRHSTPTWKPPAPARCPPPRRPRSR